MLRVLNVPKLLPYYYLVTTLLSRKDTSTSAFGANGKQFVAANFCALIYNMRSRNETPCSNLVISCDKLAPNTTITNKAKVANILMKKK